MITYQAYTNRSQKEVNQFYRRHGLNVSCHGQDTIWIARAEQEIIASLFIRYYHVAEAEPSMLLRSLFVAPAYRGLGIGSDLVDNICKDVNGLLSTLCQSDLVDFYQNFGFEPKLASPDCPLAWQKEIKKGLVLMQRP